MTYFLFGLLALVLGSLAGHWWPLSPGECTALIVGLFLIFIPTYELGKKKRWWRGL